MAHDDINARLNAIAINRPKTFRVGNRTFSIYPDTLGKTLLISAYLQDLQIDFEGALTPEAEALYLAASQREKVSIIISLSCARNRADALNTTLIERNAKFFRNNLSTEALAQLFLVVIGAERAEALFDGAGITEDQHQRDRVNKASNSANNTIAFGGRTIFGQLIDAACQRYGWTFDYVVWGIPLAALKLMLADSITTTYLTDEQRKKIHLPKRDNGDVIDATALSVDELIKMTS